MTDLDSLLTTPLAVSLSSFLLCPFLGSLATRPLHGLCLEYTSVLFACVVTTQALSVSLGVTSSRKPFLSEPETETEVCSSVLVAYILIALIASYNHLGLAPSSFSSDQL